MYFLETVPAEDSQYQATDKHNVHLIKPNGDEVVGKNNKALSEMANIQGRFYAQEIPWIVFKNPLDRIDMEDMGATIFNLETEESFSIPIEGYLYELFVTKSGFVISTYSSVNHETRKTLSIITDSLIYPEVALNDLSYVYVNKNTKKVTALIPPNVRMKIFTNHTSNTVIRANKFNIHVYKQTLCLDKKAVLISDFCLIDKVLPTNNSAFWIIPNDMFSYISDRPDIFLVKDFNNKTTLFECCLPENINIGNYQGVFIDQEGLLTMVTCDKRNDLVLNTISSDNPSEMTGYPLLNPENIIFSLSE